MKSVLVGITLAFAISTAEGSITFKLDPNSNRDLNLSKRCAFTARIVYIVVNRYQNDHEGALAQMAWNVDVFRNGGTADYMIPDEIEYKASLNYAEALLEYGLSTVGTTNRDLYITQTAAECVLSSISRPKK